MKKEKEGEMGTRVKVGGDGVREVYVGAISEFRVTFEGSDTEDLESRVSVSVCLRGQRVGVDMYVVEGKVFYVQYMAREGGEVEVEVKLDGESVFKQAVVAQDPQGLVRIAQCELCLV